MYKRCKPNLDNHVPARCKSRKAPAKQQWLNSLYNDSPNRDQSVNFPVTISQNRTISLFDKGATTSCMSKLYFNKLQTQPKVVRTITYKVKSSNRNSLSPIWMITCSLTFPMKFHQKFIVCGHLLWPLILGLDFSHSYLIGIDWFSSNQLHLHQRPKSTVT